MASAPQPEEQDEVLLQLTVANVSQLEEVAFSKPVTFRSHVWRLMVVHREVNFSDGKKDVMGTYMQHVGPKTLPQPWSIIVSATISLVNQQDIDKSYTKFFRHQYTPNSTEWGYSTFLRWKEVTNPARGFIKDNRIVVQARVSYPDAESHGDPLSTPTTTSSQSHLTPSHSTASQLPPPALSSQESNGSQMMPTPTSTPLLSTEVVPLLACPCCNERYHTEGRRCPNTLKCGHTFCLDCLIKVSTRDGSKLSLNCTLCSQEHIGTNDNQPWFPNHCLIQLLTSVLSKTQHLCPVHQHEMSYYCFQDKCFVCIYCAYHGEHSLHQCRHVSEAKQMMREGMRMVRLQATTRAMDGQRMLRLLKDEQEGVKSRAKSASRTVEEFFGGVEVAVRRQRDLLLQELQMHSAEVTSSLDIRIRELEKTEIGAQIILEEYTRWKSLPAREALLKAPSMTESLQSIVSPPREHLHASVHPTLIVNVELPCSSFLSSIAEMGRVTVSSTPVTSTPSTATVTTATTAGSAGTIAGSAGITAGITAGSAAAFGSTALTNRGEDGEALDRRKLVKVEEVEESGRQFGYGEGKRDTPPLDRPSSDEFGTRSTASTPEDSLNGDHLTSTNSPPAAKRRKT